MSDLDSLLDATLDDLEDLPSFEPFPVGAHKVLATLEAKTVNDKPAVELSFTYLEVVELADPAASAPKEGDGASTLYFLDNEFGRGKLKPVFVAFAELAGSRVGRDIIEAVTSIECIAVTTLTKNKNDPDKPYMNVKEIAVL